MSKFICDGVCAGCEFYHYGDYYNPPECDYISHEDDETLEEIEKTEYYDNVLTPRLKELNNRR